MVIANPSQKHRVLRVRGSQFRQAMAPLGWVAACLGPKVLNPSLPVLAQIVKSQAVFLRVSNVDQPCLS